MAALPESLLADQSSLPGNQAGQPASRPPQPGDGDQSRRVPVEQLILELNDDRTRENALQRLSKIREIREDLAPLLWHSFGTTFTLLKEIIAVYRLLSTPNLTQESSNRACNTLSLFQCIAAHPETREPFLRAIVPFYIYPFLNTTEKDKPHEYLRLSSLGVIGALVKDNDEETVLFLLQTQIFYHCMRCIEVGTGLSKTVATFIMERILMSPEGQKYCCAFHDRFFVITQALTKMLDRITTEEPSLRLLKLIVRCCMRLAEGQKDADYRNLCLPKSLKDPKVINLIADDPTSMACMRRLVQCLTTTRRAPPTDAGAEVENGHPVKTEQE
ncbi:hypothetical protein ACFX10_045526 [Malus domestica]